MKTKFKTPNFSVISLVSFAIIGVFMFGFFLLSEIKDPEYLIYFAPILGLLFYGAYYVINNKLELTFFSQGYDQEHHDS